MAATTQAGLDHHQFRQTCLKMKGCLQILTDLTEHRSTELILLGIFFFFFGPRR